MVSPLEAGFPIAEAKDPRGRPDPAAPGTRKGGPQGPGKSGSSRTRPSGR